MRSEKGEGVEKERRRTRRRRRVLDVNFRASHVLQGVSRFLCVLERKWKREKQMFLTGNNEKMWNVQAVLEEVNRTTRCLQPPLPEPWVLSERARSSRSSEQRFVCSYNFFERAGSMSREAQSSVSDLVRGLPRRRWSQGHEICFEFSAAGGYSSVQVKKQLLPGLCSPYIPPGLFHRTVWNLTKMTNL